MLSAFLQRNQEHNVTTVTTSSIERAEPIDRDLESSFLWSHRHFSAPLMDKNYDDCASTETASVRAALKESMSRQFPSNTVTDYPECKELTLSQLNTEDNPERRQYLESFKAFSRSRLMASLDSVIALKQAWAKDGCGIGLPEASLSEMLHHSQWAHTKCLPFQGREELIARAVTMINQSQQEREYARQHVLNGIHLSNIGVSGAGKTALMAKIADEVFKASQQLMINASGAVPVIVRFCGTSTGSRNTRVLITSICEQLELLLGLQSKALQLASKYMKM